MAESLCCSPETNTAPLTGYISQYKIKSLMFGGKKEDIYYMILLTWDTSRSQNHRNAK